MNILFVLPKNTTGGVEKVVMISANELIKRGHIAEILFLSDNPDGHFFEDRLIRLNTLKGNLLQRIIMFVRIAKNFDLIHNHAFGPRAVYVWLLSLLSSKSLITTIHSTFGLGKNAPSSIPKKGNKLFVMYRILDNLFEFLGRKVIVVSEYVAEVMSTSVGIKKNRLTVIHNVVEAPKEVSLPLINRPKNIIVIGRLADEKRIDLILSAWKIVCGDIRMIDWHLHIVGDGPLMKPLKELTTNLGINKRVTFHGNTNDVYSLINKSQLALSASRYEGVPLTVLEYMNCGVPVIASDIPPHQFMHIEKFGYMVNPENIDEFAGNIMHVLSDAKLRTELSEHALKEVKLYSVSDFELQLEKIYESVLQY